MAAEERRSVAALIDATARAVAEGVGFVPLVAWIERMLGAGERVGTDATPARELLRFHHDASLGFSTGDVSATALSPDERRLELHTTFLGLTGVASPLPLYLAEEAVGQEEPAVARRLFLDIFHHRLISFVYRAALKHSPDYEHRDDLTDAWSRRLLALTGEDAFDGGGMGGGLAPAWRLRFAALLARRARDAQSIELAIRERLQDIVPDLGVRVRIFQRGWVPLVAEQQTRLGVRASALGRGCLLGKRVLDPGARIKLSIGPVPFPVAERLRPGGDLRRAVDELLEVILSGGPEPEIETLLVEGGGTTVRLGVAAPGIGRGGRLGGRASSAASEGRASLATIG